MILNFTGTAWKRVVAVMNNRPTQRTKFRLLDAPEVAENFAPMVLELLHGTIKQAIQRRQRS